MRLTPAQIKQTSRQLEAKPVPGISRMAPDLNRLFGEHAFFFSAARGCTSWNPLRQATPVPRRKAYRSGKLDRC